MTEHLMWIWPSTLVQTNHRDILEPMLGKFTGAVVLPTKGDGTRYYDSNYFHQDPLRIEGQYALDHFVSAAHGVGMETYIWQCVGKWNRWQASLETLPDEWNVANVAASEEKDWLDFSLPEVRQRCADVAVDALARSGADGILLDYIRLPAHLEERLWITHEHVTETVRLIRQTLIEHYPDKRLLVTVADLWPNWDGRPQLHAWSLSQHWDEWLTEGLIDLAFPMVYGTPHEVEIRVAHLPAEPRVYPKISPGGYDNEPILSAEDFAEEIRIIETAGFPGASFWHWGIMKSEHWAQIEPLGAGGQMTIIDELQLVEQQLRAMAGEMVTQADAITAVIKRLRAIDDRLDVAARMIEEE